MQNTSQVLLRNEADFATGRSLLLGVSDPDLLSRWPAPLVAWTNLYHDYLKLKARAAEVAYGHLIPQAEVEKVVVVLPKSRELLNFWLTQLNALYPAGTPVWLVGAKDAGVQGASKQLKSACRQADKVDMARHCQLWRGELAGGGDFALADWEQQFSVDTSAQPLELVSIPGVFNHGALDAGTALLLNHLGKIPKGRVLDFGCGAGVLGLSLKQRQPEATVDLLDTSAEAVYASQRSAELNELEVTVFASDGLSEVEGRYAAIYSNPPFHTGVKTDYDVTERFIAGAAGLLLPGGELRIVANAHLKYPPLIEKYFGACAVVAETPKFRVYSARRKR